MKTNIRKVLSIILVVSLLFSYTFLLMNFEHDCEGEECHICFEINIIQTLLSSSVILYVACKILKYIDFAFWKKKYNYCTLIKLTLVKQKVLLLE